MERTERIKKYILSYKPEVCVERGRIYTEECLFKESVPVVIRRASAFARTLNEMTLYIGPDDLLLGNSSSKPLAVSLFPEYAVDWIESELETFEDRTQQKFMVTKENKNYIRKMCNMWNGSTHFDRVDYTLKNTISEDLMDPGKDGKGHKHPNINQAMSIEHNQNGDGHIIPDYVGLIDTGIEAVKRKTQRKLSMLDQDDAEYLDKRAFLESVKITLDGYSKFCERLALKAAEKAKKEVSPQRKTELLELSAICKKIATDKPDTFYEALQMVLLVHLLLQVESNGHSMSLGRMDSYLLPLYERDVKNGVIDSAMAQQLYECFLLKCFEANKLRDLGTTEILGGNQLFQTITLGGQLSNGTSAVNELSYIFLKALGNTNMNIPTVIVSVGSSTSAEFYDASLKALVAHGGGMPAFFNDDIAIEMMRRVGVDLLDARGWAGMGCSEVRIPGKHGTGVTPVYVNLLKILELALYDGMNPNTGQIFHPSSLSFKDARTIKDVENMFEEQLQYYLEFIPKIERAIAESYYTLTPTPFLSSVVNYRIEISKDISWGRGPNYNDTIIHAHGYPNVANVFAALQDVVFEKKLYTTKQILNAISSDFEGEENLRIRRVLLDSTKFGNDEEAVDDICRRVFEIVPKMLQSLKPLRGGQFGCTAQTVVMNVIDGEVVGATPDGRKKSEWIADNLSPVSGTDKNGLTAVFNSVSKVEHVLMDNGSILNIKLHPTVLNTTEKRKKIVDALRVYFSKGGFQCQFNVISREILEDAQRNPDKYRTLVVKVAGFSSFYTELEEKWQNHLISRTEY